MVRNICSVCNKELDDHSIYLDKNGVVVAAGYNKELDTDLICLTGEEPDFDRDYY